MTDTAVLEATSATERLVLYELAELDDEDRTPVQAPAVLRRTRDRREDLEDVVGRVTEADLVRACRRLQDAGLVVEERPDATSPVGKGRPAYELGVDPADVRAFVRDDDRFRGLGEGDSTV